MIRRGNLLWEGISTESKPTIRDGAGDGQFLKLLDTGETFERRAGVWINLDVGLSFIKATKSGRITTDSNGFYHVAFTTPFIDNLYTVALSTEDRGEVKPAMAFFSNIATTGFDIQTRDSKLGKVFGGIIVSWLATRNYNP